MALAQRSPQAARHGVGWVGLLMNGRGHSPYWGLYAVYYLSEAEPVCTGPPRK